MLEELVTSERLEDRRVKPAFTATESVLVLTSSLLIDRILLYTSFLDVLSSETDLSVWALSNSNAKYQQAWQEVPALVENFPKVRPLKEFPYNYLRRLNEYAWDFSQRPRSRLSMDRHVKNRLTRQDVRALKIPARVVAELHLEDALERWLERLLLGYERSPEALVRMQYTHPSVAVVTGPFQFEQPALAVTAKNLGIPVMALIPSWDNVTTKNRPVLKYDGYIVWSEQTKRELHQFYPETRKTPVYVVGAPQFDVFFQERFYQSRDDFAQTQRLRPDCPIILYAIGSPNFLKGEWQGAVNVAQRIMRGDLGDVQMIVRPHPLHDRGELISLFEPFRPRVVVQQPTSENTARPRSQDARQIAEWVNSFRHADVVVNLASTVMVDAAVFDRPVVNLDYDPAHGTAQQQLIKEINHVWDHTKPVVESGGVWLVNDDDELVAAIKGYLAHPELHREKRRWIAEHVCQYLDGRGGERMARAVMDFIRSQKRPRGK